MRACSSSRASCHPLMVTDPTLSVVFLATIFLLPSSLYRKGTAQINLSDAVETVFGTDKKSLGQGGGLPLFTESPRRDVLGNLYSPGLIAPGPTGRAPAYFHLILCRRPYPRSPTPCIGPDRLLAVFTELSRRRLDCCAQAFFHLFSPSTLDVASSLSSGVASS